MSNRRLCQPGLQPSATSRTEAFRFAGLFSFARKGMFAH
ncbi:hypothetical protein ALQ81_101346 [Pseudomonas syringae pv. pisi]|nr:hypothetical protein ALQ81_101346 [Pseudomonas syringae pv. pisi]